MAQKPDPAAAVSMAARLGVAPATMCFVGDSRVDMETAVAAGLRPVGVAWGFRPRAELLAAGADVIGVASDLGLDQANQLLGGAVPLQGNLDPALLSGDWATLEAATRDVVARGAAAPGHVFNLGHGVHPDTDPDVLTRLVELVHSIPPEN